MSRVRECLARLRGLASPPARDADLAAEIQAHLDMLTDDYVARGLSPDEARVAARRAFGGVDQVRRRYQDQRGVPALEALAQDLRHAVSGLRRHPAFASSAVLTLALAIGLTTTIFALAYGVLLRPLPYPDGERLVRVWEEHPGGTTMGGNRWLSHHTYRAWGRAGTVELMGAYASHSGHLLTNDGPIPLAGAAVTPSMLSLVGMAPVVGRPFGDDDVDARPRPILLSHDVWRERFGGRPDVVGQSLRLDDEPHVVVGVAPPALSVSIVGRTAAQDRAQYWVPYRVLPADADPRRTEVFNVIARLRPGVTPAQAAAEGTAAARSVDRPLSATLFFGRGAAIEVRARALAEDQVAPVRSAVLALGIAVTLILLVGCANVANLMLTRGAARQREFAIRLAIGASRARLAWQVLVECLALSVTAGVAGTLVAATLIRVLPILAPDRFPRLTDVRIDGAFLGFAATATLATALLAGLLPVWRQASAAALTALRSGDGGTGDGFRTRRARRTRDLLLIGEAAMAVVLLVGALVLGHSLARLLAVDPGYRADAVLGAVVSLPQGTGAEPSAAFIDELLARLRGRPGIEAVGAASTMPLRPMTGITTFPLATAGGADPVMARAVTYTVTPGYAEAMGLRLEAGRLFAASDQRPGIRAMLVNVEFARRYLPDGALGHRFEEMFSSEPGIVTEVIGVVGNVLKDGHDRAAEPEIYFVHGSPARALGRYFMVAVRGSGDPAALAATVRAEARALDAGAVVERTDRVSDLVAASLAQPRFAATVMGLFAGMGLLLAAVGLFAVLSYGVAEQRRELGVRAALGAGRGRLLGRVLAHGLTVTTVGLVFGLGLAAALTRLLEGLLFGVTPLDPVSFGLAPVVLLLAATAASLLPAWRAARLDPVSVLRDE